MRYPPTTTWSLVLFVFIFGMPHQAHADLAPTFQLVGPGVVPANGVLQFNLNPEVTVRIVSAEGDEVAGDFVAPDSSLWKPAEDFEVGSYVADVEYPPNPKLAEDRPFEVTPAIAPSVDFIEVRVASRVRAGEVLEEACCREGSTYVGGQACTADCKPLCVPLSYAAEQYVEVDYAMDWESIQAEQSYVSAPPELHPGEYGEGYWPVEGAPDQLCGVAQVFSWLDESTTLVSTCISNPKPELHPIQERVSSFGYITECTLPPVEYISEWCSSQVYTCEVELLALEGAAFDSVLDACTHYYELCDRPAPIDDVSTDSDVAEGTSPGEEVVKSPLERDGAGESGCACAISARSSNQRLGFGVWGLLTIAVILAGRNASAHRGRVSRLPSP